MSKIIHFYDTSALLSKREFPDGIYVSSIVLDELESIKTSMRKDEEIKARARAVVRHLIHNEDKWIGEVYSKTELDRIRKRSMFLEEKNDHWLICEALILSKKSSVNFYTSDGCLYLLVKNEFPELTAVFVEEEPLEVWNGYREVIPTEQQWKKLLDKSNHENIFDALMNEYIILLKTDGSRDIVRWSGIDYVQLGYKNIKSQFVGDIKPINEEQKLIFDLLQNPEIPIVSILGQQGSGKTFLAIIHALEGVKKGIYNKIYYIRNNVNVADVPDVGALPGDLNEKLREFLKPISDSLGGEMVLDDLIEQDIIEPAYLGTLKGRNLENAFIFCDEGEDLTIPHAKLIVGRVAKNSKICVCGDLNQLDLRACLTKGSGLLNMNQKLRGLPLFGSIRLKDCERSAAACYANYLG